MLNTTRRFYVRIHLIIFECFKTINNLLHVRYLKEII